MRGMICQKFGWLRISDHSEMVTTVSYQNPKVEFINIELWQLWMDGWMVSIAKKNHGIFKTKISKSSKLFKIELFQF